MEGSETFGFCVILRLFFYQEKCKLFLQKANYIACCFAWILLKNTCQKVSKKYFNTFDDNFVRFPFEMRMIDTRFDAEPADFSTNENLLETGRYWE